MNKKKRIISIYMVLALVMVLLSPVSQDYCAKAAMTGYINVTGGVYFRESPNGTKIKDPNGKDILLQYNQALTVEDTSNGSWYKVSVNLYGKDYTGYVASWLITLNHEPTQGNTTSTPSADGDFEAYLSAQGFPESYKVYLRKIHEAHPNWVFKAVLTGIDWNTLLKNECNKSGSVKNTVQGTSYAPHYNWRSTTVGYSYVYDSWTAYDGSTWFAASDAFVAYYLDPRTYLYENYIFAFESLSYHSGVQTEAGVEAVLNGTFMSHAVPAGESKTYAQLIMDAAATSGVSPYHIASRMKQEMGATAGVAANGKSPSYPGIYNYFNVGAVDTAGGGAVNKGLAWASQNGSYGRPWNSPSKAINGGAQYLGTSYISVGQNTLYTQKFNVTNKNSLYSHQYMTNVQAPATECLNCYNAYRNNGMLENQIVFEIPVYLNMPETAMTKPADSGSPNNWLKTLSVSGYNTTPTFATNYITDYTVTVPANVSSVSVSATPVNANARITGTGNIAINQGTNKLQLTVTAQNGATRVYNLTIIRGDANAGNTSIGNAPVASGSKGDLNGDGTINVLDIVKMQRVLLGFDSLDLACDLNGDGEVTILDLIRLQRHLLGVESISS